MYEDIIATFEVKRLEAFEAAGVSPDVDPDSPDLDLDSQEHEDLGAAVAWGDACDLLRDKAATADPLGAVLQALRRLERAEPDTPMGTTACRVAALLRSVNADPASPNDLIYLAGEAVDQACEQSAAAMAAILTLPATSMTHDVQARLVDLGHVLRDASESSLIR